MNRKDKTSASSSLSETLLSEEEVAQRITELERRSASHTVILRFLQTVLDFLTVPGALHLTAQQRAELSRRLDEFEKDPEIGPALAEIKKRVRKSG
ncbi:MAG TPA: hypothetical protein VH814_07845 [Steroidobacteraceae bacterium]|jgi:putative addiction module component (TIGR02574 family)